MQDVASTKIASKQKLNKQQIKALSSIPEPVSKPLTALEIIRLKGKIENRKRVLDGLERRRQKQIKIMTDFTNDKDNNYYIYAVENILNYKDLEREKDKQAK